MSSLYEQYETLALPLKTYYPAGQEEFARQILQEVAQATKLLEQLLNSPAPALDLLIVSSSDWEYAPPEDMESSGPPGVMLPYWTEMATQPTLVVPDQMDDILGDATPEKLALLLYHEVAHAFLESDPRPWPEETPLWADEWQMQFAEFWLFQQIHGETKHSNITADLHEQFAEIFEPEADGKTPVTIRGFDWYEDTTSEDYLEFALLLEKFAIDLLARYDASILPRFLERYRKEVPLLSDEVTLMLAEVLGSGEEEWLENLVYF